MIRSIVVPGLAEFLVDMGHGDADIRTFVVKRKATALGSVYALVESAILQNKRFNPVSSLGDKAAGAKIDDRNNATHGDGL